MVYYTAVAMLCCAALVTFCLMLGENGRLSRKEQLRIYVSFGVLFLSFLAEWSALALNGAPAWTTGLHIVCKCLDYCLSPALGLCLSYMVLDRDRLRKYMTAILGVNAFMEIISAFTGHIYYIDSENIYHHGPAYMIYVAVFAIAAAYVVYAFVVYSRRFRKSNPVSLAVIVLLVAAGIIIQELIGGYIRTACVSLSFGMILIFIHYTQYGLMKVDEHVVQQQEMLDTDTLSGCMSRHAYEEDIGGLEGQPLPADLVILSVDINDLKNTNDTLGHAAGDELIRLSSACLMDTFKEYGRVYRTGGDEFVVILRHPAVKAPELLAALQERTEACRGEIVREVCLSCGYAAAAEHPEADMRELFNIAEKMMYADKAAFYRRTGRNRRSDKRGGNLTPGQVQRLLQNILIQQYYKIQYGNLSEDTFTTITVDEWDQKYFSSAVETGKVSAAFAAFADSPLCYEEDRKKFREFTDLNAIRSLLTVNHFRRISLNYRRKFRPDEPGFSDAELRIVPVNFDPENLNVIIFVSNLSDEREARKRERNTLLAAAFPEDTDDLRRTVLVISDSALNRELLESVLEQDYDILPAENCREALEILSRRYDEVSAVLMDVGAAEIGCREFLQIRQGELLLRSIPVIVLADADSDTEEKSFEMGASDFVRKPCEPIVIRHRLHSLITLRENVNGLSALETDELTGLFTREAFFSYAENLLRRNPDTRFDLILSDIQDFKFINNQYGRSKSDDFLRFWGRQLKSDNIEQRIAARYGSDQFVMLMRNDAGFDGFDAFGGEQFAEMNRGCPIPDVVIKYGVYQNVDHSLTIPDMCDRAMIALRSVKGRYGQTAALFNSDMLNQLNRERILIDSMDRSLTDHDFRVYYQALHDAKTGALVGAEALSRWVHPKLGRISPEEFIPLFERNGFVTKLDLFVWERVCSDLRAWLDAGMKVVPISINVSRRDLASSGFREKVLAIAEKHGISHDLLHMEVTESVRADGLENSSIMLQRFREDGFCMELDDFGSGYASLNLLNRMPLDVIKLDIGFARTLKTQKEVVRTIISLGHEFGYSVIAEGVETEEQLSVLREMNCDCIQGYYFSKALPHDEFTEYAKRCGEK